MIVPHLHLLESGVWPLQGPQKLGDPVTDGGTNGQTPGCGGKGATKGAAGPQEKEVIPPDPQGTYFVFQTPIIFLTASLQTPSYKSQFIIFQEVSNLLSLSTFIQNSRVDF